MRYCSARGRGTTHAGAVAERASRVAVGERPKLCSWHRLWRITYRVKHRVGKARLSPCGRAGVNFVRERVSGVEIAGTARVVFC